MINRQLKQKILRMAAKDRKLRNQVLEDSRNKKLIKHIYNCDTRNILEAKKIIKKYGWPTFNLVGKKASGDF